jgi:imidazole glycerol-phosphate synthase subunit HisH
MTIAVVDYGMGNLRSVAKAIEHVAPHSRVLVTSDAADLEAASRVVFPGQGAMPDCMRELDARGLRQAVLRAAATRPFLGVCIGLQMLFERSEEGDVAGLGLMPGRVRRFPVEGLRGTRGERLKVPHMGWNQVRQCRAHALWGGIEDLARFYFVHSYFVDPAPQVRDVLTIGQSEYGVPFTAAVARDNIVAVQFHPEKSQASGLRLLANFALWNP